MTKQPPPPGVDLGSLMASEFHELKNQLGYLTLALGEVVSRHPDAAPWLLEPRRICQNISDRLVQALTLYKNDQGRLELNVDAQTYVPRARLWPGKKSGSSVIPKAARPFGFSIAT